HRSPPRGRGRARRRRSVARTASRAPAERRERERAPSRARRSRGFRRADRGRLPRAQPSTLERRRERSVGHGAAPWAGAAPARLRLVLPPRAATRAARRAARAGGSRRLSNRARDPPRAERSAAPRALGVARAARRGRRGTALAPPPGARSQRRALAE